jgi:hypothetical protein
MQIPLASISKQAFYAHVHHHFLGKLNPTPLFKKIAGREFPHPRKRDNGVDLDFFGLQIAGPQVR